MRTLTIARATWREAIRQPVSIIILVLMAGALFLSAFLNFFQLNEETGRNALRQMAVAQTMICGFVIAVFSASAVLSDEIENRTILTLLAKPIRRYQVVVGKFLGIMLAVLCAFAVMMAVALATVWWDQVDEHQKGRVNPALVVMELPMMVTGQSEIAVAGSYETSLRGTEPSLDYAFSFGDVMLLVTGQNSQLAARAPLSAHAEHVPAASPGLAYLVDNLLGFFSSQTGLLFQAFLLAFMEVMVIAAIAVAVSTRLPLVFNALFCAALFVLGNLSHYVGEMLASAAGESSAGALVKAGAWLLAGVCFLLPNFDNFNLSEALSVGIEDVPGRLWVDSTLYGLLYTALVLVVGVMLFQRREVA